MATPFPFTAGAVLTAAQLNAIGEWITYTPTWTNLTVGNATQNFRYLQVNDGIFVIGSLVFGNTTSMGTAPNFTLPLTSATGSSSQYWGTVSYLDSGTEEYIGTMKMASTTTMALRVPNVAATYPTSGNQLAATTPFTWTTNDAIFVSFFYQAA